MGWIVVFVSLSGRVMVKCWARIVPLSLSTNRGKGPFYPPRVNTILNTVQLGAILPDESIKVCALLCEFADIFALWVKEVKPISTTKY